MTGGLDGARIRAAGLAILLGLAVAVTARPLTHVFAQTQSEQSQETGDARARAEALEALETLSSVLEAQREQRKEIARLKSALRLAKEDASKKELEQKIATASEKLKQIDLQLTALSTGVSSDQYESGQSRAFDITAELRSLAEPFVRMMKDATANARQIQKLRGILETSAKRKRVAERALARLKVLQAANSDLKQNASKQTRDHLNSIRKVWSKRLSEAEDLRETTKQQLSARLSDKANAQGGLGTYATQFFRNRGLNLLLAIMACGGVFLVMNLIARIANWIRVKRGIRRSFATRLISLLHTLITIIVAFLAMLAVFNVMNDWLLIGIASVFAVAAAWIGLKVLPNIIEQITLLLNLGAVQEGERVMWSGVPWLVRRLDFYTDLVNPELDGGSFTMPARELIGLHSRPAALNEPWFPTKKGHWVQLSDGRIGRVISQTPELVQIEELGGSVRTFDTAAFVAEAPRNLSSGFRIKYEIGLDYRHQDIAPVEIPRILGKHVRAGLQDLVGEAGIVGLDVDLLRAADSALVFEVETDIAGEFASRYEDIEREIASLVVGACNAHKWSIPYPQLVLHNSPGADALPQK